MGIRRLSIIVAAVSNTFPRNLHSKLLPSYVEEVAIHHIFSDNMCILANFQHLNFSNFFLLTELYMRQQMSLHCSHKDLSNLFQTSNFHPSDPSKSTVFSFKVVFFFFRFLQLHPTLYAIVLQVDIKIPRFF